MTSDDLKIWVISGQFFLKQEDLSVAFFVFNTNPLNANVALI